LFFVICVSSVMADSPSPEIVKSLAPTGQLRAAINFGNPVLAQRDIATGEPRGVSAELARELASRLEVPVEFVIFEAAGKVVEAAKAGAWDIAFVAIDPARANEMDFTAPYVVIEGTYLVAINAPFQNTSDLDHDGVRIAVVKNSAYDLFLTRTLKEAQLVRMEAFGECAELFQRGEVAAIGGVRQPLVKLAQKLSDARVLPGRFMVINQAMATPKGLEAGVSYLRDFVEDMKASGFIATALQESGQGDAMVAPPAGGR
jgi:polar amino acid transport system substrate-binding protein